MSVATVKTSAIAAGWSRLRQSAMLYGMLATGMRVGANILLLPLMLKVLSPAELALWWVFLTLGFVANLADFGFGQVIGRVYCFLWAGAEDFDIEGLRAPPENREPNLPRLRQFHAAVQRLYLWIAFIGMALLAVTGTFFVLRPAGALGHPTSLWLCWGAFIAVAGLSLSTSRWTIACYGVNRVRESQAAQLVSGLVYVVSAATFLVIGWGLFALVAAMGIRAIVTREISRRAYNGAAGGESKIDASELREIMKRIWPNARKFGGIMVAGFMVHHSHVLICSHFLGTEMTASYGLTVQIGNFIASFASLWLLVKWPQITILRTQGRLEEMAILFARRLGFLILTFVALSAALVLCGNQALEWKGANAKLLETPYLVVYLVHAGQQAFYAQFGSLAFTENVVPFVKLSLWTGVVLIGLSVLMVQSMGLWGLLLAPIISTVAASSWYITRRGFQGQPLNVRQFARAAVLGRV